MRFFPIHPGLNIEFIYLGDDYGSHKSYKEYLRFTTFVKKFPVPRWRYVSVNFEDFNIFIKDINSALHHFFRLF